MDVALIFITKAYPKFGRSAYLKLH